MIKRLSECIREYKKASILSPIFVSLEVLMEVLIPTIMAYLVDYGIDKGNMSYIVKVGVVLVVLAVLSMFFGVMSGKYAAFASAGFAKNLRRDMYYNVQKYSFSSIDKFSSASIVTRLTTDVTNLQNAYQMIIRVAVRSPIMLIFAVIMSLRTSYQLALVIVAFIPVLALGLYLVIRFAHPIFEHVFKTYDTLNRIVQENLRGIRVVKSFVREEHEKDKFKNVSNEIYSDFCRAEKLLAFNAPLMQLCSYSCMILISWIGARMIVASGNNPSDGFTTGQFMSFMTYLMQILMSLMMLSMIFVMITISRASAERIVEILDEKSDIESKEQAVMSVKDGSIVYRNVSFGYGNMSENTIFEGDEAENRKKNNHQKYCLKNINLTIQSGQTVGIIGGTGSSKSSLVQLIPRLYDVTEGEVLVGGVNVKDYDLNVLRNDVAMVLQKNVLFSGTIKENLRWGNANASEEEIKKACKLAQADSFIQTFPEKYDTYIEQGGTNVSGGQKQRLCIARALLKKPKILIMDDSTSAVDTKTDAFIREAMLHEIPDTTKIIIAQRISSVEDADMIIVLENGEINGMGTHDELLKTNAVYREVYESQVKGEQENG